jgi:hypothetical protein
MGDEEVAAQKLVGRCVVPDLAAFLSAPGSTPAETPDVGARAPDFTLSTPEGQPIRLSDQAAKGKVVLVVLRGYPGYPYW